MTERTPRTTERELLLLICTGNVARSPLAAAMIWKNLGDRERRRIEIGSAGVKAVVGAGVEGEVTLLASMHDLDLTYHVARNLDEELVRRARLIVAMTESQRDQVGRSWPGAIARTFTLIELNRLLEGAAEPFGSLADLASHAHARRPVTPPAATAEDVVDPAGRSLRFYMKTAEELERLTARFGRRLVGVSA